MNLIREKLRCWFNPDRFPHLHRSVIEVNSGVELRKVFGWKQEPLLDDPWIFDYEYPEDANQRRLRDAEFVYQDTRKILKKTKSGSFLLWHDFNLQLVQQYEWIHSVCEGVERLYAEGHLQGRIYHVRDSSVGIHRLG